MKSLTNDEFISAFQKHHGEQMAAVQTYGKFQGSGKYWDEFRRRLTVADQHDRLSAAKDAVIQAADAMEQLHRGTYTQENINLGRAISEYRREVTKDGIR